MPLRLIEATLPAERIDDLQEILDDRPVLHHWISESTTPTGVVHLLVDAEHVEQLTDSLAETFDGEDDLRLILLAVEGTLPVITEEQEKEAAEKAERDDDAPPRPRVSREELYDTIFESSRLTWVFAVMVAVSSVVAAVGLIRGDVAVIVGAMVIAPLIGPIVAMSLACALGDLGLARHSVFSTGVSVLIGGGMAALCGFFVPFDPESAVLLAKTRADLGDVALALAAGTAGSLAFTGSISSVLVGVMVAVALLPPLVAAGLFAGAGLFEPAGGALTLLLTNVVCINLASAATFYVLRIRPRTWNEEEQAKKAMRIAVPLWILLLGALIALIYWADLGKAAG